MIQGARYVHTNLIGRDWRRLAEFYQSVLGCIVTPPERCFSGPQIEAATGVSGASLEGIHLRLPGNGDDGPTLEIFTYSRTADRQAAEANRPGFGHIAIAVDSVADAQAEVLSAGGSAVGENCDVNDRDWGEGLMVLGDGSRGEHHLAPVVGLRSG